jgi:hypothetical protein
MPLLLTDLLMAAPAVCTGSQSRLPVLLLLLLLLLHLLTSQSVQDHNAAAATAVASESIASTGSPVCTVSRSGRQTG